MRFIVLALVCIGSFVGCSESPAKKLTSQEERSRFFDAATANVTVRDGEYAVAETDRIVVFSSPPLFGKNTLEQEGIYLHEYLKIMKAADKWMKDHPDEKSLSLDASERGGTETHGPREMFYTVRVTLLKE